MLDVKALLTKTLNWITTKPITPTVITSAGTTVACYGRRTGNVVWLYFSVRNTSSVASGGWIYEATVSGIPLPGNYITTATYYGARSWAATLSASGVVRLRNTYSAATTMGASDSAAFSFTYIV